MGLICRANFKNDISIHVNMRKEIYDLAETFDALGEHEGASGLRRSADQMYKERQIPAALEPERIYSHPAFKYYPDRSVLRINGQNVTLTGLENRLLNIFSLHPNRVMSHEQLIEAGWKNDEDKHTAGLRLLIFRLRRKLGPVQADGSDQFIRTVTNVGYKLLDPSIE